jgi:membrane-bound lytic murein transglycosylase D
MTRRWTTGWMALLAACGGRMQVGGTHPASIAPAPPGTPPPAPVAAAALAVPQRTLRAVDTTASRQLKIALDSVADAIALDSLARVMPAASLPDLPIESHAMWDLNVADFADQPRVKYYLDYFTSRAHDRFQVWLQRMARFELYAREQFIARKLPGDFVYLALIESGFSPDAVSRAYAVGMWQFMVGTGRLYGLRVDGWLDERRDPLKSTDAAAHHLDDLTARFGSHYLAAAAYNAGAGRVERGLGHMSPPTGAEDDSANVAGDGAFFSLADTRLIRDETKNYVPQLIAAAIIAKEPSRYGFDSVTNVAPFSRDSVMVDGGTGLDLIARLADTSIAALRDLNPNLLRLITPPGEVYPVRVPTGTAERVAEAYAALPTEARHAIAVYHVRAGETVTAIARRYGASAVLIRSANRSARGTSLVPGTVLYVPLTTAIPVALLREPDPPRTMRTVVRTYIVRAGENITRVARRARVSAATLRNENHLTAAVALRTGQRLTVHRTMIVAVRGKR